MRERAYWRRYLRFWGPDPGRDAEDELSFHLEMKRAELLSAGVPPDELEREVARAFGDAAKIHRELREIGMRRARRAHRAGLLDELTVDLKHTWRSFRRRPGVPLVVVTTLALAIGAGTAVFSMLEAVVLNPLAVHEPDRLLMLYEGENQVGFSYPMVQYVREHSRTTRGVAAFTTQSVALRSDVADAEQLTAGMVTGDYFDVLGLRPQAGRLLGSDDEAAPGTTPHAVLSDALWRRSFGSDPAVVGRTVRINEVPFTVVGIAPPRFRGTSLASPVDLWLPLTMVRTVARSGLFANPRVLSTWYFTMLEPVVRLRPRVTPETALAELRHLHAIGWSTSPEQDRVPLRLTDVADFESNAPRTLTAAPLNQAAAARSRDDLLRFLRLLTAAVVIALAVACVNVANLMLMRGTERERELSIRAAVGAARSRVIRQLLVESAVLALLAGVLGAGLAFVSIRLLGAFSLPGGIALAELGLPMDGRVLGFTAGVAVLCALGFGLAPAIASSRTAVMDTLRGGSDGGRGRSRAGNLLLTLQVALSILLLVAGSLFVRSLQQALAVDLGFRSAGVGAVSVGLRQHGYTAKQLDSFVADVLEHAAARPGVQRVAAASYVPLEGANRLPVVIGSANQAAPDGFEDGPQTALLQVTPGYLELLSIPLLHGRDLVWADRDGAPRVALVTESAARRFWPDQSALGQQFVVMFGEPYTVVGVVADAHLTSLTDREPHLLLPLLQSRNLGGMDRLRLIAAAGEPGTAIQALRSAVQSVDRRLPTFQERSLEQQIDMLLMPQRFGSILLSVFSAIALLISAVGIYAVAAYNVARRHREIGIRAALGAGRARLIRVVVGGAGIAICAGVAAGLFAAAYATRALRGLLFGIGPTDPLSYAAAVVALVVVALLASWVPARSAARVDPLVVMRE